MNVAQNGTTGVHSVPMGGRTKHIRIRSDEMLKEALAKSAERNVRSEQDEARYILMKALGLISESLAPPEEPLPKVARKRRHP